MPFDSISVVHRELVVEIVIALPNGDEGSNYVISGRMLVVERCLAKPVSERVDAKGGLAMSLSVRRIL